MTVSIGAAAPDFSLNDTAGESWSLNGAPATVLVFTCNHCPYALAWHDRIAEVASDYEDRGVVTMAINSNDADRYPRDSYDAMRQRVAEDGGWPMPYLHDASQEVARAYGAEKTPDVFVLDGDGALRYRGAPDGDYDDPGQRAAWLREALDSILSGEAPKRAQTKPVGCSIKWKP